MNQPWYQTTYRWMQTNLVETDPACCDVDFWAELWKRNHIQGIIVNAGGIVAYYPSHNPLQYRAKALGDRDLLMEFIYKAHQNNISVLARMDVNRADDTFYRANPKWFAVNSDGSPYKTNDDRYYSCINSGYYHEHIPEILKEIIESYHPEGFTDNSWAGMKADHICYCDACRVKFKKDCDHDLPEICDFSNPIYRKWIQWSYRCRTEIWDLFNEVTTKYGGQDCLWLGMMNVNPAAPYFCDLIEIGKRSKIVMSDYQARDEVNGFEQNGIYGGVLSNLTGYDRIHPESIANYVRGRRVFRLCSNTAEETKLWLAEGISGQLSPWLHYVGGCPEDRRQLENCQDLMDWHHDNEKYLYKRLPAANVALLWSQENSTFYGRKDVKKRMELPWRGFTRAMISGRIPFQPVNTNLLGKSMEQFKVIILPDLAAVSNKQIITLEDFVKHGGSIVYTGASGMLDEEGEPRLNPALDRLLGIKRRPGIPVSLPEQGDWMDQSRHNYLRLPENRHPILDGFEKTDILPFGGIIQPVESTGSCKTLCTFIPDFPIYPPELSCMDVRSTDIPVILAGDTGYGGRVVYFAADIDRLCGEVNHPDHLKLLEQAVRYAAMDTLPLHVSGRGYLDCKLYRQENRLILQIINLSGCNEVPAYVTDFLPVSGVKVAVRCGDFIPGSVISRISGNPLSFAFDQGKLEFILPEIEMQELIIIE
jgi:hypothetical protein